MGDFAKLGLKKDILAVLSSLNFKETFEVQDKIIPLEMKGKNVVFTSRTGSGKTLTYLLGFLGKLSKKQGLQMLVLVPTRELCIQVGKEMKKVCDPLSFNVGMLYGGREIHGDYKTTNKKNQIIIGTPGRLIQHVNERKFRIGEVKYLVFDESDQMFDSGFYEQSGYLKKRVSKNAQIILSSATLTNKVHDFIDKEIVDYELLKIGIDIPVNIVQEKINCKIIEKNELLLKFFPQKKFNRAIVFCNTKQKAYGIAKFLQDNKFNAKLLTGNLKQNERLDRLNLFKEGKIKILVATDVASRGLHIENVDIIVNYDVPTREEFYVHRIGRTGRVDKKGYALIFVCPEDEDRFNNLKFNYKLNVNSVDNNFEKIN